MKLICYELLKIWNKRLFITVVIILLSANSFLFYNKQMKENPLLIQYRDEYWQMEKQFKKLSRKEGRQLATEQGDLLTLYSTFNQANASSPDSVWHNIVEQAKKEHQQAYKQYTQSPYFGHQERINKDAFLTELIRQQYENIDLFRTDMNEMQKRAEEMLSVSIFYEKDSFAYRNIVKTVQDFTPLRSLPLDLGLEEGLTTGSQWWSTDIAMAVMLFLLCTILFHLEKEEGLTPLIRATRNGKLRTYGAKLTVLSVLTVVLTLLFYGSILIIAQQLFGFGDLDRYIQSMSSFDRAVEPMTVGQYIIDYIGLKIAINFLFAWVLTTLFLILRRTSTIYAALAVIVGGSFICYVLIHPNSYVNGLKYLNIAAFYDTYQLIADYRNLHVFGFSIRKDMLTLVVGGAMLLLLPLLNAWLHSIDRSGRSRITGMRWINRSRAFLFQSRRTNSLFQHEWYKLLNMGNSFLILVLACLIAYQHIDQEERRFDMESVIYNHYAAQLFGGKLDADKLTYLQKERAKFTALPKQFATWDAKFSSNEIDFPTYNQEKIKIEEFAKQEKSFLHVEKQRDYLLQLQKERGITGGFVNVISSDALFNRQQDDLRDALIFTLLLLIGLSPLLALDYRNSMMTVLRSTLHGRGRLFAYKHMIAYLYSIILLCILQFPKFYNMIAHYPRIDWHAPVQSIEVLGHLDWPVTIIEYVIATSLLQIAGILLLVNVILLLAIHVQKQMLMLLTATTIVVMPLCLQYVGVNAINIFSFNPVFQLYYAFGSFPYTLGISLYYGTLMAISSAACWIGWRIFNSAARKGH